MRYRAKPKEIEAIRFRVPMTAVPDFVNLRRGPDEKEAGAGVWAHVFQVWNELHSSWIRVRPGDYLRVDDPGDVYPIDAGKFEATYEPIGEDS